MGLALAAALAGCSPPRTVEHDLAALLPVAEAGRGIRAGRGTLFLPPGTEAVYYLDLPGASELSLAGVSGPLAVEVQEEGEARRVLGSVAAGTVELPGKGRHLLRLALRSEGGAVRLARPRVVSEAPPLAAPPARQKVEPRPNVVIYLVDTLRADRLGCYGYPKPTSPHLDRFAEGATLFENAVAQAPWTRPSVASVLTGLNPLAHGVRTLEDRLPDAAGTLAERLRAAGYRTAAFSTNAHVGTDTGFAQGFDDFLFLPQEDSASVSRRIAAWLDRLRQERFLLYVHTLDPHSPYTPPLDLRRRFAPGARPEAGSREHLRRIYAVRGKRRADRIAEVDPLYDAEIAANDRSFGALLSALKERRLFEDSLIVFVSDHGEALGERGAFGHAQSLYAEELDVPLVVKLPGQTRGERVSRLSQHVDLLPTVLAATGLPPASGLPGRDLFGPPGEREPAAFSHLSYRGREGMSVVFDGWKRIDPWNRKLGKRPMLYRRGEELRDIAGENPVRNGFLGSLLRVEMLRGRHGLRPEPADMDEEARRQLEALGYL